jgi:hypothetical protein
MDKFERIYSWYTAGGRLKLPLELKREIKHGVYEITPVFLGIQESVEREVWEWLAGAMAGFAENRFDDVGKCSEYGWKVNVAVLSLDEIEEEPDRNCYTFEITIADRTRRWEQQLAVVIAVPYGANDIESIKFKSIEEVRSVEATFERCKGKLEMFFNDFLSKLLKKVAKLRDEYKAGWRLQLPLQFVVQITKVAVVVGKISRMGGEVCSWLGANIEVNASYIDAEVSQCRGSVCVICEAGRYGLKFLFTSSTIAGSLEVNIYHDSVLKIISGKMDFKNIKVAQVMRLMFDYVKREIEERLNGVLEKILFE